MDVTSSADAATAINDSIGTYSLHELIRDVPLSSESGAARITAVDAWNGNLYIGTSAGEVLHYVSIPPDPEDDAGQPSYIFATKLEPDYITRQEGPDAGVRQILLLPDAGKACVLCHGTLTFYTLPELSPAFGGIKQGSCTWVGGLDTTAASTTSGGGEEKDGGREIVICLKSKLRVIRIGDKARRIRDIELGSVMAIQRMGNLACVADENTYALLDVVNQRKNDLFPISSLVPSNPPTVEKPLPEVPRSQQAPRTASKSVSSVSPARQGRTHERNISLGVPGAGGVAAQAGGASPWPARASSRQDVSPQPASSRDTSPAKRDDPSPRVSTELPARPENSVPSTRLKPNIVTPTSNEFLLTTGTQLGDPGVGMFVNMDGDVTRGTIEFSSYPESLVLDTPSSDDTQDESGTSEEYVLALVRRRTVEGMQRAIEVQRLDGDSGDVQNSKEWIGTGAVCIPQDELSSSGLRIASSAAILPFSEISASLRLRRLPLTDTTPMDDKDREREEDKFAARFDQVHAKVLFYDHNRVMWAARNPLISIMEMKLALAVQRSGSGEMNVDISGVQKVINSIRGQEARNELEFLTLTYTRQKVSLLLFGNLVLQTASGFLSYERDKRFAEEALVAGDIDPRVVLSVVPTLMDEVVEGRHGIWIAQGLRDTIAMLRENFDHDSLVQDPKGPFGDNLLSIIKRYLFAWRKKKGFGSVADEGPVFQTVDAALLHLLLILDQNSPRGPAIAGSIRAELNDVVDRGVDCFDRAVALFEKFNRLYMLSRLYQSRKMVAQVLATWKRILDGEIDAGGELIEGEHDLRRYLTKIRDPSLVQEYGAWLAGRNAKLGVQVFADDSSRVKFEPSEAVAILKDKAPGAVKDYLEHLVFGKNLVQYVNDLIAFYLDTVLSALETSAEVRDMLLQSYETYRALRPPKPTYRQFIMDNAVDAEWSHNRLRLLQLIGGSHGAASRYDVHALGERLAPYSDELVPEMIILNGREGKHEEALRLLTHGLGDYDTAIRYCLLGGSSIFHPAAPTTPSQPLPSKQQQSQLFEYLLHDFLRIEDVGERLDRTSELLERFGAWFEVDRVLNLIPDSWSVHLVSAFLMHALRRLVLEKNETIVVKALSSAQNLRRSVEMIEKVEGYGGIVVRETEEVEVG